MNTADNERDFAFNTKNYVKKSNRGLLKNMWRGAERQLSEMAIKKLDCIISFFLLIIVNFNVSGVSFTQMTV